jgi:hypothetical protein
VRRNDFETCVFQSPQDDLGAALSVREIEGLLAQQIGENV